MALSTVTVLTDAWAQVVTDGNDYVLQNNGNNDIYLFWKATSPLTTDVGFKVKPGNGIDSGTFLTGAVWARAKVNGSVIVNE